MTENQNQTSLFKFGQPRKVILQDLGTSPFYKLQIDRAHLLDTKNVEFKGLKVNLKQFQNPASGSQLPAEIKESSDQKHVVKMQTSQPFKKVLIKPSFVQRKPNSIVETKYPFKPRILKPKEIKQKSFQNQSKPIEKVITILNNAKTATDFSDLEQFEAIPSDTNQSHNAGFEMPSRPEINNKLINILTKYHFIARHVMMKKNMQPIDFEDICTDYMKLYKQLVNKE